MFVLWTGLRTSELVALDWGDIDWLREEVMVSRAMTQASKGTAETTKTAAGRRSVKLLKPAMEALKAQKAHTFLADAEVFQNPRTLERWAGDGPIRKTMWVPAMKKAGVRYSRPYQTQHTYASMMSSAGEHPMWVAKQMGHTDWTMIARVYGRWMPSSQNDAGAKAEALFSIEILGKRDIDMFQSGHINFFNVDKCGLYSFTKAASKGLDLSETFEKLKAWAESRSFETTNPWDPKFDRNETPCYCRQVHYDEKTGDFLLVLWKGENDKSGPLYGMTIDADGKPEKKPIKQTERNPSRR